MDIDTVERQSEHSLLSVLGEVRRNRLTFVGASVIAFIGLFASTLALPPVYVGSALLLSSSSNPGDGDADAAKKGNWKPPKTLAQIAQSDDVVRTAIEAVGLKRLAGTDQPYVSAFLHLRFLLIGERPPAVSAIDSWLPKIQSQLNVRGDTTSDILSVDYRNPDPAVALAFTSALTRAFIDAESSLYAPAGTAEFFRAEQLKFLRAYEDASQKFTEFSVHSGLYAPDEQRKNLLQEYSDFATQMAKTREDVVANQAKRSNILTQLRTLEVSAHSQWVNNLVAALGNSPQSQGSGGQVGEPPDLLTKVYEGAIAELLKANGDVAASQSLAVQQTLSMAAIENHLRDLTKNKSEFDLLSRNLGQAVANLAAVAKRAAEEQVASDVSAAKVRAIKVVQEASVRSRPAFPNYPLMLVADSIISAIVGVGAACLRSVWRRRRRSRRLLQARF